MLKIKDLNVSISNKQILKDFNLEINEGEIHVIMGTNGVGKSTLVKTLSDHYDCEVHSGQIEFKGKDLLELDASQRANEGIFMSFQNPVEVHGVNNMYFLKTAVNEKRAYQNQEEVNSAQFLKEVKDIIKEYNLSDEIIKRNVNEGFSGGEKKKNEMLQLLVLKPDLIMLDEIDSGLDIDAIKLVAKAVNSMLDGKRSVLMITHYDRLLELIRPDFVHILKDGKIIKSGDYNLALEVQKNGFEAVGS
ncbi:Fe-S cluster assembly ATPase SufC [Malaciobacter mytili]|uniref:Fe-S cluster assembly ATPase SufC n=1 Tax=Malaciobacter mytili LMG 24559 TaxID=1032238 RepID=A0AAX2AIP0_9BACT|nr:Fe-S cluster assembly ATPase SufC [Malaciobacter mytili]AXH14401.1 [Fe-S] cluster assembly scaffold SufBCD, ATP-binding protein [Malaciobacter mytili LMG 24559]RXI36282.1 Fe-S cluster assembly ATPase SufC [Malaciobacter mytili]RXK16024.1 Fe-S cluster assembly ATPase SufC [Malaciobacter mytili LMG 24559]